MIKERADILFKNRIEEEFDHELTYPSVELNDAYQARVKRAIIKNEEYWNGLLRYKCDYVFESCRIEFMNIGFSSINQSQSISFENCIFDLTNHVHLGNFLEVTKNVRFSKCKFYSEIDISLGYNTSGRKVSFYDCDFLRPFRLSTRIKKSLDNMQYLESLTFLDCYFSHHFILHNLFCNEINVGMSNFLGDFVIENCLISNVLNIYVNKFESKYFMIGLVKNRIMKDFVFSDNEIKGKLWFRQNTINDSYFNVNEHIRVFLNSYKAKKISFSKNNNYRAYLGHMNLKYSNLEINKDMFHSLAFQLDGDKLTNQEKLIAREQYYKYDRKCKFQHLKNWWSLRDYVNVVQSWITDFCFGYYLSPIKTFRFIGIIIVAFSVIHFIAYGSFNKGLVIMEGVNVVEPDILTRCINSLYFSIVSMTTLGYGDLYYTNLVMKLVASFEGLIGVIMFALLASIIFRKYSN